MYVNDVSNVSHLVPETGGDVIPKASLLYNSHQRNKTMSNLNAFCTSEYNQDRYHYTNAENQFSSSDNIGLIKMPTYSEYIIPKSTHQSKKSFRDIPIGIATSDNRYSSKTAKTSRHHAHQLASTLSACYSPNQNEPSYAKSKGGESSRNNASFNKTGKKKGKVSRNKLKNAMTSRNLTSLHVSGGKSHHRTNKVLSKKSRNERHFEPTIDGSVAALNALNTQLMKDLEISSKTYKPIRFKNSVLKSSSSRNNIDSNIAYNKYSFGQAFASKAYAPPIKTEFVSKKGYIGQNKLSKLAHSHSYKHLKHKRSSKSRDKQLAKLKPKFDTKKNTKYTKIDLSMPN